MKQLLNSSSGLRMFFCARIISIEIMQVALYVYLATCGTAIAEPGTIKAPTIPPRYERPEILNGGLQSGEFVTEKCVDVLRPSRGIGVDGTKLGKDGSAKSSASNSSREQENSNGCEVISNQINQVIQGVCWAVLVAWPIMFFGNAGTYGLRNLTDKLTRRRRR